MNHLFDEVPESEAVGKKLIRAKWLNDDRDDKARERLVARDIAAFEGKRDDNHAMTPPLKVARMLVSRASTGYRSLDDASWVYTTSESHSSTRQWRRRYTFACHVGSLNRLQMALLRRALYGRRQASWLWQKAVDRALKELHFVHLVVVPCTYFHEA